MKSFLALSLVAGFAAAVPASAARVFHCRVHHWQGPPPAHVCRPGEHELPMHVSRAAKCCRWVDHADIERELERLDDDSATLVSEDFVELDDSASQ